MFLHIDAVYSLSVSPVNDNVFASSSDDGRVLIWDTREPPNAGERKTWAGENKNHLYIKMS